MKVKIKDETYRLTYHASFRWTMRITQGEQLQKHHLKNTAAVNLHDYGKALVNENHDAVFLLNHHRISTVIPLDDLDDLLKTQGECRECGAKITEKYSQQVCGFCHNPLPPDLK